MIKLVVTDLDGTLLNEEKQLPEGIFELIEDLHKQNILFAVASGRPYFDIVNYFKPVKDKIIIISDNGTIVYNNGKKIFSNGLDFNDVSILLDHVNSLEKAIPNLSGSETLYVQEDQAHHFNFIVSQATSKINFKLVKCLKEAAKNDDISKISILDLISAEDNTYANLQHKLKDYNISVSGPNYLDVMKIGVNKGFAIKKIQDIYDIDYNETMVFGDFLNDLEMMHSAYHSYAMSNAHPKVKEIANFEAPSNNNEGVVVVIKKMLEEL